MAAVSRPKKPKTTPGNRINKALDLASKIGKARVKRVRSRV